MQVTKTDVARAYREAFASLRDSAAAHNAVLARLAPPYRPDMSSTEEAARSQIALWLAQVSLPIERSLGDPLATAIYDAMRTLRAANVKAAAKAAFRKFVEANLGPRPTKWQVDELLQGVETPYLYLEFTHDGDLANWTIDYRDTYRGHSGPVAAVPIHARGVDYADIQREIEDILAQAEIGAEE